jgi:hypothetical protein
MECAMDMLQLCQVRSKAAGTSSRNEKLPWSVGATQSMQLQFEIFRCRPAREKRGVAYPPSLLGLSLTLTRLATAPEAQLVSQSIVSVSRKSAGRSATHSLGVAQSVDCICRTAFATQ